MLLGKAKSPNQVAISKAMRRTPGFKACASRLWWEHSSGLGLGFVDAGSRQLDRVLSNLAAAFGRRRTKLTSNATTAPRVIHMLSEILESTSVYETPAPRKRTRSSADLRPTTPQEANLGASCAAAPDGNRASHVGSLAQRRPGLGACPPGLRRSLVALRPLILRRHLPLLYIPWVSPLSAAPPSVPLRRRPPATSAPPRRRPCEMSRPSLLRLPNLRSLVTPRMPWSSCRHPPQLHVPQLPLTQRAPWKSKRRPQEPLASNRRALASCACRLTPA